MDWMRLTLAWCIGVLLGIALGLGMVIGAEADRCAAALALSGPLGTLTGAESASATGLSWADWLALQVAAERC